MYKTEVPLYGDLVRIVQDINATVSQDRDILVASRLDLERHGAIRLGNADELRTIRRVFALIGLYPVDYYDLSVAGLPMHATAFRPIDATALSKNPFRVFTTLLRPEMLRSKPRELALSLLNKRKIFSDELLRLVEADIDMAEAQMKKEGLAVKSRIEGPPARRHPILLRQTSFLALEEQISFPLKDSNALVVGHHRARFGEIEQRGAAVTRKGRALYDRVLEKALKQMEAAAEGSKEDTYRQVFHAFPDDWQSILNEGLIYFEFKCSDKVLDGLAEGHDSSVPLKTLVDKDIITAEPITYEDFLPFSAAGIFRSNLQSGPGDEDKGEDAVNESSGDREGFEAALGCQLYDSQSLYASMQANSLVKCAKTLKIREITPEARWSTPV
ncbi:hypothetical protein DV737_g475, partial [Chaetothyriales sp. CBS 132003]